MLFWLVVPVLVAFPILYRSNMLLERPKVPRVMLLLMVAYLVFAASLFMWFLIAMAFAVFIVILGGSFG